MSLLTAVERFSSMDRSTVGLDSKQCLHAQDQFSSCQACFGVCPVGAILPGKPPVLDNNKCDGCLTCLPICPVDAYEADDEVQPLLACAARIETNRIELLCTKNPNSEQGCSSDAIGVQVRGCLAGLGVGSLMALVAMGMESIFIRTDACSECNWGMLHSLIETQVDQARELLGTWNKASLVETISTIPVIHTRPLWNAHNPPLSRRDLFRMASRQGQVAIARSIEQKKTGSKHTPGRDRRRIVNAVEHLSLANTVSDLKLTGDFYAMISVSDACTACGLCARACPTNALHFLSDDKNKTYQLSFLSQYCIGCELCAHLCAASALEVITDPLFNQVFGSGSVILNEGNLAFCENCNVAYAFDPETHLCPTCNFRKKNPFGSKIPPGIKIQQVQPGRKDS
jgi:ferredoxin